MRNFFAFIATLAVMYIFMAAASALALTAYCVTFDKATCAMNYPGFRIVVNREDHPNGQ